MQVQILKSKLHRVTLTGCELEYEGSLTIDLELMEAVGIFPGEKILVVNQTNGQRLETYAIAGPRGSRAFRLNGAAARLGQPGDMITIMAFGLVEADQAAAVVPGVAILDARNEIVKRP